jgi:DNA-directed RNA polymerase subunit alpha
MISQFKPSYPTITTKFIDDGKAFSLVVEPLMPGFGSTIGNSIRRALLSSVPGAAVTKIRINDITHEYQAIDGVSEDALEVVLNLKMLRVKFNTDEETATLRLEANAAGEIYAKDFADNASAEIVNKDQYICSLSEKAKLVIELEIERGVGYLSVEDLDFAGNTNPQNLLVDAYFSPVTNVAWNIEQVRVGDKTNFDKLTITYTTDDTVDGAEIADYVLELLINLVQQIRSSFQVTSKFSEKNRIKSTGNVVEADSVVTDQLNLPTRIKNILAKNDINTNSELKARMSEVEEFAGITEKSLQAITEYLETL